MTIKEIEINLRFSDFKDIADGKYENLLLNCHQSVKKAIFCFAVSNKNIDIINFFTKNDLLIDKGYYNDVFSYFFVHQHDLWKWLNQDCGDYISSKTTSLSKDIYNKSYFKPEFKDDYNSLLSIKPVSFFNKYPHLIKYVENPSEAQMFCCCFKKDINIRIYHPNLLKLYPDIKDKIESFFELHKSLGVENPELRIKDFIHSLRSLDTVNIYDSLFNTEILDLT